MRVGSPGFAGLIGVETSDFLGGWLVDLGREREAGRPYTFFAASAALSPNTSPPSSGRMTPAFSRRWSFWYFLMAALRVPRPRVAHLGREATIWRPSCSIISL